MMTNKHFLTITVIPELDELTINDARRHFFAYKEKGIVRTGLFDEDKWILSDERDNRGFDFSLDEAKFHDFGAQFHLTSTEFKQCLKTFIVCNLGNLSLTSLQHIILAIKRVVYAANGEIASSLSESELPWLHYVTDFLSMLPAEGRNEAVDAMLQQCDDTWDRFCFSRAGKQRTLATFESYFRFHDALKRFWAESVNEEEKLFFFPAWLWWNITGVVPMRPHEFVLTPRDCLEVVDGKFYITLRKNKIKGSGKTKGYRISEDYQTVKYQIPAQLGKEIQWYLAKTRDCSDTEIGTLFATAMHYRMWQRSAPYTSRYFTYTNLKTCLRYYYKDILQGRYGYRVLMNYEGTVLPEDDVIEYIRLGDTRHIALINLIAEGASPVTAMLLAGHDNPAMSAHYYSNISTLVECRVYRQYRKMMSGEQVYALSGPQSKLCVGQATPCSYGGACYSSKAAHHDYSDCYRVTGPEGEMGYCPNCDYYRDNNKGFHDAKDIYKRRIETECSVLHEIVTQVRRGRGSTEEIASILNRLSSAAYSYEQYLLETMEVKHAKAKVD